MNRFGKNFKYKDKILKMIDASTSAKNLWIKLMKKHFSKIINIDKVKSTKFDRKYLRYMSILAR